LSFETGKRVTTAVKRTPIDRDRNEQQLPEEKITAGPDPCDPERCQQNEKRTDNGRFDSIATAGVIVAGDTGTQPDVAS
jgi:hypothetical protein